MSAFKPLFGKDVLINAALWVATRLPEDQCRLHKIFKILWFADLYHLKKYGRTVTGDTYIAMNNGPVPSVLYDEMKPDPSEGDAFRRFDRGNEKGFVVPLKSVNADYLSETDVEALTYSLNLYKDKSFDELTQLSHKHAWNSARNAGMNTSIRIDEILDEIGAEKPTSWADLASSDYKGEIMMSSPAVSGTNYAAVAAILQTMGEDKGWEYLTALNENIPYYTKRGSDPSTRVAAGEAAVGITYIDNTLDDILADGTLEIVYPEEGMPYIPDGVAAFANADDTEDAKLFIQWLFSSDENLRALADIDKKSTMLLALPTIDGLELDFDPSQLMTEDLSRFGSDRDATLARWDEVTSGKEVVSSK